ncbi:MAG: hypothetical protein KJ970_17260 [Candidatus Eisenbacteria bacterium]|uniref:Uncharacterized protein n=1 Tax=Eiseniibacteriota bacterium TaxID=2212470 RepID=A0A948S0M4_UNCEI|nr:hypothetical protein [Candidatus Eisenbacteria bacterium]MBU1948514.1 hypothetical protein [Candidatus Eisenbacteria bacterium]MBU2692667.1 hypothetical protein [Candidatus Eisenbacteria bacterium]
MKRLGLMTVGLVVFALFCAAPVLGDPTFEWDMLYDGGAQYRDVGTAALTDADGNLVVGGSRSDLVGGTDLIVRLLDRETGTTLWTATWAINDQNDVELSGMVWDGFGNLLVAGYVAGCEG